MNASQIDGYKHFIENELEPWLRRQGFMPADMEVVGQLLQAKYRGQDDRLQTLEASAEASAEALLASINEAIEKLKQEE